MSSNNNNFETRDILTNNNNNNMKNFHNLNNQSASLNKINFEENLSDSELMNEGTSYWNTEKLCDFNDNKLKQMKNIDSDNNLSTSTNKMVHSLSSHDAFLAAYNTTPTSATSDNSINNEIKTTVRSKTFLEIPKQKTRRTSLPSDDERPSPNISPRRFFEYIRREFSSDDLKRRQSKSPILSKKPLSVLASPKLLWSNKNENNHTHDENTPYFTTSDTNIDDIATKENTTTPTTPTTTQISTTAASPSVSTSSSASSLLSTEQHHQQQQQLTNKQKLRPTHSIKQSQNNTQSPEQSNYFSKRRNTISTIAFHKLSPSSTSSTGFGGNDRKFSNPYTCENMEETDLFELVEQADMDGLKHRIQLQQKSINNCNDMGLAPLDVAIMLNHVPMIRLLIQNGARESKKFLNSESRYEKICKCLEENENCFKNIEQFSQFRDYERKILYIENRIKLLKRMKLSYEQAGIPEQPTNITLHVTGKTSITVTFDEPLRNNGAMVTNYKVEWCSNQSFEHLDGEALVTGIINRDYEIKNLITENQYYVRVSCSNMKGYSNYCLSDPPYVRPNSWRDGDSIDVKLDNHLKKLEELKIEFQKSKESFDELFQRIVSRDEFKSRKSGKGFRKNLISLFMPNSNSNSNFLSNSCHTFLNSNINMPSTKFVKQLKKGAAYLVMIAYELDKVLITQDDNLPILEIDDHYQLTTLQNDMQFLIKISMNWEDIKTLKKEMEHSIYTSNLHFRYQLLKVTCNMKNLIELNELGRVYNQPLKDQDGNIFFILTKKLKNTTVGHNLKLMPVDKYLQRITSHESSKDYCVDILVKNLKNIIEYDRYCDKKMPKGLYLAYLKIQSSMDLVRVMVLNQKPSILPCQKIRENPNVSKEEWQLINELCDQYKQSNSNQHNINEVDDVNLHKLSEKFSKKSQHKFIKEILNAAQSLGTLLKIPEEQINDLKLYTSQVIEITKDISLLLVYSPVEQLCIMPHSDENSHTIASAQIHSINTALNFANILKKHTSTKFEQAMASISNNRYIYLPIQIFETLNLYTYDRSFIKSYSKLSTALDIEYNSTLQYQREAFSNDELNLTKQKLSILSNQQHKLDDIWKESRWLIDVINNARDRNKIIGVPLDFMKEFFDKKLVYEVEEDESAKLNENHLLRMTPRIPSVVIHDENQIIEEQIGTINLNDEFDGKNLDYSYISSGYHSDEIPNSNINQKYFDELANIDQNDHHNSDNNNFVENVYSSISYIHLKNVKVTCLNSRVSASPTSSSTSTSSMSVSTSTSSSSSSSTNYVYPSLNENDELNDLHKDSIEYLAGKSIVNIGEDANFFYHNNNGDDEPIELGYTKSLTTALQQAKTPQVSTSANTPATSLTQSFSSLIASVYNSKTIVVYLAVDNVNNKNQQTNHYRMVNFKINSATTALDVIRFTLNAFNIVNASITTTNELSIKPSEKTRSSGTMRALFASLDRDENAFPNSTRSSYCLVVILGCRERVLNDNYYLYQLKEPWINGRFYIRLTNDPLAALDLDKYVNKIDTTNGTNNNSNNMIMNSIDAKI